MENVSKALLIAAAVLLAVMLLSLLFVFWDNMASYYNERHEATMLEQLVEFNNKFQNYNGKTIRGNELVSIMNLIVDYNNYQAGVEGYEKIKITIDLQGHQNEFKYDDEKTGGEALMNYSSSIITNSLNDEAIKKIATTSSRLTTDTGIPRLTDTKLQKMSSNIDHIVDDEDIEGRDEYLEEYIKYRDQLLTRILGYKVSYDENIENPEGTSISYSTFITRVKNATYQYYQYTLFKRAMFECTDVFYDETNGRVNEMKFKVILGDDGRIKLD